MHDIDVRLMNISKIRRFKLETQIYSVVISLRPHKLFFWQPIMHHESPEFATFRSFPFKKHVRAVVPEKVTSISDFINSLMMS